MDLRLPDLGEGVMEGEIVKWHVKAGDAIKEDQVVLEIMTDKATVEIPAKGHGTVTELMFKEGDIAKVGAVIMKVAGEGAAADAAPAAASNKAGAPTTQPSTKNPEPLPGSPPAKVETPSIPARLSSSSPSGARGLWASVTDLPSW